MKHVVVWIESLVFDYRLIETDVKAEMSKYGDVVEVMLLDDVVAPDIAIVEFEDAQSARKAVGALNGVEKVIEGYTGIMRAVELTPAVERALLVKAHILASSKYDDVIDPFDHFNTASTYTCRYVVGADKVSSEYSVIGRIVGVGGENVKSIFKQTNAHVRLNGKPKSRDDPLHVRVSAETREAFEKGKELTEKLIQEMYDDYAKWCERNYVPIPAIRLRAIEGSETLRPLPRLISHYFGTGQSSN
jgi:hypothetical protein